MNYRVKDDPEDPDLLPQVMSTAAGKLRTIRVLKHRSRAEVLSYFVSHAAWIANHAHEKHLRELLHGPSWSDQTAAVLHLLASASGRDNHLNFGKGRTSAPGRDTERRLFEENFAKSSAKYQARSKRKRKTAVVNDVAFHHLHTNGSQLDSSWHPIPMMKTTT
jgi:hypothetical protein